MRKENVYTITFDYEKEKTNPLVLLSNITKILNGFDNLNKAICKSIDTNIEVSPCLVDIEQGSIKLILIDILNSVPDEIIKEGDYKKVIGHFLCKVKHFVLKSLNTSKQLSQKEREIKVIEVIEQEYLKIPNNKLLKPQLNKENILNSINEITQNSKNMKKVSFGFDEKESEIIDTTFEYVESKEHNNKITNIIDISLPIKKPDLLGNSMWEFIFVERRISATIEDENFLNNVKKGKIAFYGNTEMKCRIRTEILLTQNQKPTEEKYFIEKVYDIINPKEYKQIPLKF